MQDHDNLTDRQILLRIHEDMTAHAEAHKAIEARLTSLEHARAYAAGAVAVLTAGVYMSWDWLKETFGGAR